MQDRQVFEQILGIASPWFVADVELALQAGEVRVSLEHRADATWHCPECGRACALHDHQEPRRWRHLDTCQYQTVMSARLPRTKCPEHGVKVVRVPWAEPLSRFTMLFERLVIAWMKEASQSAVAEQFRLSWDEVHGIMDRAVERGLARREAEVVEHLGVDEKSFKKRHKYATLVYDLDQSRVLYVAKNREKASLDGFWKTLTQEQLNGIVGVAIDMWDRFEDSIRQNFDRESWREFQELRQSNLKTARARAIAEQAQPLWDYQSETWARKYFRRWYNWATHSRLKPIIEKAKMLKRRLSNILTYAKHHITNAVAEGLNSKIQWVKATARGFRNFDNFTTAIYFHCGGLDLNPGH